MSLRSARAASKDKIFQLLSVLYAETSRFKSMAGCSLAKHTSMRTWRRNLLVLFFVQLIAMAGFSMVFPFLPLYIKELGVSKGGSVEFWSGMVFSSQAITMMISAPLWGFVADRHGRKIMLARATLGGSVILAAMAFVQNAEQLTLLRAIQGFVTGTIPAANALVAASAPGEKTGEALGLIQMGAWIGIAVGPFLGGIIGDAVGFRESFLVTGGLLAISGFSVVLWVKEDFSPVSKKDRQPFWNSFRMLLKAPQMMRLYTVTFLQTTGRMVFIPVASLFVMELMRSPSGVATVTGLMMGLKAFTGSVSAVWLGRVGDRIGHVPILLFSAVLLVFFNVSQAFVADVWQLLLLQALTGLANGGMVPSISAMMNVKTSLGSQGATYGLNASITAAGRSIAPLLGATVAFLLGMRAVFVLSAILYGSAVLVVLCIYRKSDE